MRKFHSIAALCGDGLRPELQALFDRLAIDPHSELFVRGDGMVQAGPNPATETTPANAVTLTERKAQFEKRPPIETAERNNTARAEYDRSAVSIFPWSALSNAGGAKSAID
jgi:hypothetical protein